MRLTMLGPETSIDDREVIGTTAPARSARALSVEPGRPRAGS
jgi:hypothetical protein